MDNWGLNQYGMLDPVDVANLFLAFFFFEKTSNGGTRVYLCF
jgi:hypothetical protein